MKLNYREQYGSDFSNPEFEQFKRQILRQAGTFGVFYGADTGDNPGAEYSQSASDLNINQSGGVRQTLVEMLKKWVLGVVEWYQNGDAIRRLLKLSDSALQDIGLDRKQLEALRLTGGSVSDYVSSAALRPGHSTEKPTSESRFELIDCSDFKSVKEHDLDRAA